MVKRFRLFPICVLCALGACKMIAGYDQAPGGDTRGDDLGPFEDGPRDLQGGETDIADGFVLGPYTTITPVFDSETEASDHDTSPSLTGDMTELFFHSAGRTGSLGNGDIWVSTRPLDEWGTPVLVDVSSIRRESSPAVSLDGLTLAFASGRGEVGGWDIYIATRPSREAAWSAPVLQVDLNTEVDELPGFISDDRSEIVFHGGEEYPEIYRATRANASDPWGEPTKLTELNSESFDSSAQFVAGGLVVVFDSDRAGGKGVRDIYWASRSSTADAFSSPVGLSLNSNTNESSPWLAEDLSVLFFARSDGTADVFDGTFRIYEARP